MWLKSSHELCGMTLTQVAFNLVEDGLY